MKFFVLSNLRKTIINKSSFLAFVLLLLALQSAAQTFTFKMKIDKTWVDVQCLIEVNTQAKTILYGQKVGDTPHIDLDFKYTSWVFLENGTIAFVERGNRGANNFTEQEMQDILNHKWGSYLLLTLDKSWFWYNEDESLFQMIPQNLQEFKREHTRLWQALSSGTSSAIPNESVTFGSEPYRSTAVRDIRNKKDLNFDDLFYLLRAKTPISEVRRYYAQYNRDRDDRFDFYKLSLSKTILGHPLSEMDIRKSYYGDWRLCAYIYFGPTHSSTAINEANHFLEEVYRYLVKRGRRVYIEENGAGRLRLKYNEENYYSWEIAVADGGLYKDRNGNSAWGVVIHISYPYK